MLASDSSCLPSVKEPFCINGGGKFGSLLRRCNGVETALDPRCNATVRETPEHRAELAGPGGRASVPVLALRNLWWHAEVVLPYGKRFCATIHGYKDYVFVT